MWNLNNQLVKQQLLKYDWPWIDILYVYMLMGLQLLKRRSDSLLLLLWQKYMAQSKYFIWRTRFYSRLWGCAVKFFERKVLCMPFRFIFYLRAAMLFPTKSKNVAHPRWIPFLFDPRKIFRYVYGTPMLGYIYRILENASHKDCKSITNCTTILILLARGRLLPDNQW